MKFIDTHTHLFLNQFDSDRNEVITEAINSGVEKMILPNVDLKTLPDLLQICKLFPTNCLPAIGLHPCSVKNDFEKTLEIFENELKSKKYFGIGETGIDLYWDKTTLDIQKHAFIQHIKLAKKYQLPIIIHARESYNEIFEIIDKEIDNELLGIFHCFSGNEIDAEKILSYKNFKFGIGGVVTYKTSNLDKILKNISIENIVLETDSPYLPPVPNRGKRNKSSYIIHIAEKLSEIYNIELKEIAGITSANAIKLFNLKD